MWKVIRASVAGTSHAIGDRPCQDDCFADVVHSSQGADYLVCVVSDGAGSAAEGGKGSEMACVTARTCIEAALRDLGPNRLESALVEGWISEIRRVIGEAAERRGLTVRDYACTLLGAVVGPGQALFFQIGDWAMVAACGCAQGVVFWPDSGPYANMTYFVTDDEAFSRLQVVVASVQIDELALFSDGIQRLALSFEQQSPYAPFFEPMLNVLRALEPGDCDVYDERLASFLNSQAINERTDDDKTLVIATRRTS